MGKGEQDLTLNAKAKGFEETAKKVDQVADAQKRQTEAVDKGTESHNRFSESVKNISDDIKGITGNAADAAQNVERVGVSVGNTLRSVLKTILAIKGVRFGLRALGTAKKLTTVLRTFGPLLSVIFRSSEQILRTVRAERREHERILELMKIQAALRNEAEQARLGRQASVENIASRRREGGFASADIARRAGAFAGRVRAQFTQITEVDANLAAGLLGDAPGVTQEQITDLAILAKQARLGGHEEALLNESPERRLRLVDRLRAQFRSQIDRDVATESQQGQGVGRKAFRPDVTERGQHVAFGDAGNTAQEEELLKVLPEGAAESGLLAQAIKFRGMFSSKQEFDDAIVKITSLRGLTALSNRAVGTVEVALPDQPGFLSQELEHGDIRRFLRGKTLPGEILNRLGIDPVSIISTFEEVRTEDADAISRAFEALDRQGRPGIASPNVTYQDNRVIQHNGRYIGIGAQGRRRRSRREIIE